MLCQWLWRPQHQELNWIVCLYGLVSNHCKKCVLKFIVSIFSLVCSLYFTELLLCMSCEGLASWILQLLKKGYWNAIPFLLILYSIILVVIHLNFHMLWPAWDYYLKCLVCIFPFQFHVFLNSFIFLLEIWKISYDIILEYFRVS